MNNIIKKETYKGFTICIITDDMPENPRTTFDNLGTMICWHKRESYGDEQPAISANEYFCKLAGIEYTEDVDMRIVLAMLETKIVWLPIYMYSHSGVVLQTTSFNDRWDSGLLGYIYVTREKLETEGLGDKTEAFIKEVLQDEVKTYSDFLCGNVYGFEVYPKIDDISITASWGYYGDNFEKNGLLDSAKESINAYVKTKYEAHFKRVKEWIKNKVPYIYRKPSNESIV